MDLSLFPLHLVSTLSQIHTFLGVSLCHHLSHSFLDIYGVLSIYTRSIFLHYTPWHDVTIHPQPPFLPKVVFIRYVKKIKWFWIMMVVFFFLVSVCGICGVGDGGVLCDLLQKKLPFGMMGTVQVLMDDSSDKKESDHLGPSFQTPTSKRSVGPSYSLETWGKRAKRGKKFGSSKRFALSRGLLV